MANSKLATITCYGPHHPGPIPDDAEPMRGELSGVRVHWPATEPEEVEVSSELLRQRPDLLDLMPFPVAIVEERLAQDTVIVKRLDRAPLTPATRLKA